MGWRRTHPINDWSAVHILTNSAASLTFKGLI